MELNTNLNKLVFLPFFLTVQLTLNSVPLKAASTSV